MIQSMGSDQIRSRIIDDIERLDWYVMAWRALNKNLPSKKGDPNFEFAQKYYFFLEEIKWAQHVFSIIRLIAITNDHDPKSATLGKLLNKLVEENKDNKNVVKEIRQLKKKYSKLKKSPAYLAAREMRRSYYAHNTAELNQVKRSSYRELFGLIEKIVSIYNDLVESHLIKPRGPYKYGNFMISDLVDDAVQALQRDAIKD